LSKSHEKIYDWVFNNLNFQALSDKMFRKRNKKAGGNLRRKRKDEDDYHKEGDGGSDGDDEATSIAIRKTTKKHKILGSLPLARGGGNSRRGENQSDSDQTIPQNSTVASADLSVLATKHKNNMETFIEQQMAAAHKTGPSDEKKQEMGHKNIAAKGNLYQQLAREITDGGLDKNSGNENGRKDEQQPQHDGDQGDGGAALLGGTGIAEVILTSTRHPSLAVSMPTNSRALYKNGSFLSSAVPEEERHKHSIPNTTPKPFVQFRKNNNNTFTENKHSNQTNDSINNNIQDSHDKTEVAIDANRKGFDVFRGRTSASDFSNGGNDAQKNVYQNNRRKTGRERDDQVYSHFLKNALNGNNRR